MTRAIIFDASTLISFAMNGLFEEFRSLKKAFKGHFLITEAVKDEVIDNPIDTKRFKLEALKIRSFLEDGVLALPSVLGIDDKTISTETARLMDLANATFFAHGKPIHLISSGETACLALSSLLTKKGIENVIAVDERTIRLLGEKPENLRQLFQKKLNASIVSRKENYQHFQHFKFIRSAELSYVLYKKGLTKLKGPRVLEALLYAMKYKGCAISEDEIREIEHLT